MMIIGFLLLDEITEQRPSSYGPSRIVGIQVQDPIFVPLLRSTLLQYEGYPDHTNPL